MDVCLSANSGMIKPESNYNLLKWTALKMHLEQPILIKRTGFLT